jgi:hypothetical protein
MGWKGTRRHCACAGQALKFKPKRHRPVAYLVTIKGVQALRHQLLYNKQVALHTHIDRHVILHNIYSTLLCIGVSCGFLCSPVYHCGCKEINSELSYMSYLGCCVVQDSTPHAILGTCCFWASSLGAHGKSALHIS